MKRVFRLGAVAAAAALAFTGCKAREGGTGGAGEAGGEPSKEAKDMQPLQQGGETVYPLEGEGAGRVGPVGNPATGGAQERNEQQKEKADP